MPLAAATEIVNLDLLRSANTTTVSDLIVQCRRASDEANVDWRAIERPIGQAHIGISRAALLRFRTRDKYQEAGQGENFLHSARFGRTTSGSGSSSMPLTTKPTSAG